jgi:hypothetical protein
MYAFRPTDATKLVITIIQSGSDRTLLNESKESSGSQKIAVSNFIQTSHGGSNDALASMSKTNLGAQSQTLSSLKQMASLNRSMAMNIFYIIGVVVVIILVAGYLGLRV